MTGFHSHHLKLFFYSIANKRKKMQKWTYLTTGNKNLVHATPHKNFNNKNDNNNNNNVNGKIKDIEIGTWKKTQRSICFANQLRCNLNIFFPAHQVWNKKNILRDKLFSQDTHTHTQTDTDITLNQIKSCTELFFEEDHFICFFFAHSFKNCEERKKIVIINYCVCVGVCKMIDTIVDNNNKKKYRYHYIPNSVLTSKYDYHEFLSIYLSNY